LTQNRYIYLRKLAGGKYATEYAWGPSIKYTVAKQHTLANGQKMPLWAKLETPQVRRHSVLSDKCWCRTVLSIKPAGADLRHKSAIDLQSFIERL